MISEIDKLFYGVMLEMINLENKNCDLAQRVATLKNRIDRAKKAMGDFLYNETVDILNEVDE